jgi:hypothetical protein
VTAIAFGWPAERVAWYTRFTMKRERERVLSVTFLATTYDDKGRPRFNVPRQAVKLLGIKRTTRKIHIDVVRLQSGEQLSSDERLKSGSEIYRPGIADRLEVNERIIVRASSTQLSS